MSVERTATLAAVWMLIAYEFVTYNVLFVPGFFRQYPVAFWIVYPIFLFLVLLLVITYYKSIVVPPGSPSPDLNHCYSDLQQIKRRAKEQQQIKKAIHQGKNPNIHFNQIEALQRVSYCFKCDNIKPIRTHHCKICGICVERMDHHCPWVGNCVGLKNHKYFIQFLLYSSSALAIVFWSIAIDFYNDSKALRKYDGIPRVLAYLCGLSSGCLALSIGVLFLSQIYTLAKNVTTLESFVDGLQDVSPWKKPTFSQNVQQITGRSSWFLPTDPFPNSTHYMPVQL